MQSNYTCPVETNHVNAFSLYSFFKHWSHSQTVCEHMSANCFLCFEGLDHIMEFLSCSESTIVSMVLF